jgi:hypothetical protein
MFCLVVCQAGAVDEIIVGGRPPITMKAVDCHIRLIEFVLDTRLTVAQKDAFLNAIKNECAQMPPADRNNFLSACELVDSMSEMEANGHQAVKFVLQKDFADSATSLPEDPAAVLYLQVDKDGRQPAISVNNNIITEQSLAAFIEYLEFLADHKRSVSFSRATKGRIKGTLQRYYQSLKEVEQACLDDFQLTWYMIRAGWQLTDDFIKKQRWQSAIEKAEISENNSYEFEKIRAALNPEVYGEMLDAAARAGAEPLEWVATNSLNIW